MAGLISWLKNTTVAVLDPQREQRIQNAAAEVERQLAVQRKNFALEKVLVRLDAFKEELPAAIEAAFKSLVRRAWRDASITESERKTLNWASDALKIPEHRSYELIHECGIDVFRAVLLQALEDGKLELAETEVLKRIAASLQIPLGNLIHKYFGEEASFILRGMFATIASDNRVAEHEWTQLVEAVAVLGLTVRDLKAAIRPEAQQIVGLALAEAKADGRLAPSEETGIRWLVENIIEDAVFVAYVRAELNDLRVLERIEAGLLPSIEHSSIGLRAGEIVHAEARARFTRIKRTRQESYDGALLITDCRLIFNSDLYGFEVNHRRAIDVSASPYGFALASSGKGAGKYEIFDRADLFVRTYFMAIRMANQTKIAAQDYVSAARNIPRDVRQRVWQRYGGCCAQCGAKEYLEFDHVIPVSRGGGNGDNNVQLLCRRCNLSKSDNI